MDRKEVCSCKSCMLKCHKCAKIIKNHHIYFDEKSINQPQKHYFKLQIKKSKLAERSTIKNKIKGFKNHRAAEFHTFRYNKFNKNLKKKYFVDTLRNFFILPKEEANKVWREKNLHKNEYFEKIAGKQPDKNFIGEKNNSELLEPISTSVQIHTKLASRVPNITRKRFNKRKMSTYDQVNALVHRDFPLYIKKAVSNNINRTRRNDFIAQWFKHGYEQKYKSLQTFSTVFKGIGELETTKKFCDWLKNHTEIEPPPYLLEHGLLERNISDQTSSSSSTRNSWQKNNSLLSLEINDDYINRYFKQFKYSFNLSNSGTQSISNRFISEVEIII